jgi:ankyrin repeat protein
MNHVQELFQAIQRGDLSTVGKLVALKPVLANARGDDGVPAVLWALYNKREDVARTLVSSGAELDLRMASALGELELVEARLRAAPEDLDRYSPDGFTALHYAAFFTRAEVAAYLIGRKAKLALPSKNAMLVHPLHSAATTGRSEVLSLLLAAGAPVNARQQLGWTPLHAAVQVGDSAVIRILLAFGADARQEQDEGKSALSMARAKNDAALLRLLGG